MKKNKTIPDAWKQLEKSYKDAKKSLLERDHEEAEKMNFKFSLNSRILIIVKPRLIYSFEEIIENKNIKLDEKINIVTMVDEEMLHQLNSMKQTAENIGKFIKQFGSLVDFNNFDKNDAEMIKEKVQGISTDIRDAMLKKIQDDKSKDLVLIKARPSEIGIKHTGLNLEIDDIEKAANQVDLDICSYEDILQILINLREMPSNYMILPAKQNEFGGYFIITKNSYTQGPETLFLMDEDFFDYNEELIFICKRP